MNNIQSQSASPAMITDTENKSFSVDNIISENGLVLNEINNLQNRSEVFPFLDATGLNTICFVKIPVGNVDGDVMQQNAIENDDRPSSSTTQLLPQLVDANHSAIQYDPYDPAISIPSNFLFKYNFQPFQNENSSIELKNLLESWSCGEFYKYLMRTYLLTFLFGIFRVIICVFRFFYP